LLIDHKYRKNKKDFFVGRVERDAATPLHLGEVLYDVVSKYEDIVFGFQSVKQKFLGFILTHNWIKRSIFLDLSYWKTNLLRHNLDIMHIKKNVFKNILNTIIDVKRKKKDNIKVRMDITLFCHNKDMKFVYIGSWVANSKASFALDKNA